MNICDTRLTDDISDIGIVHGYSFLLIALIANYRGVNVIYKEGYTMSKERKPMIECIGEPALLEQFAEECVEAAKEALKLARILRGENPTPRTEAEVRNNLVEEVTDVNLCARALGVDPDLSIWMAKEDRFYERWEAMEDGYTE
jgi:hypothetical protein